MDRAFSFPSGFTLAAWRVRAAVKLWQFNCGGGGRSRCRISAAPSHSDEPWFNFSLTSERVIIVEVVSS